ncbi:MAG: cytochrome c maturation protein CcmE [Acidimicrobiales bacterium]
MTDTLAPQAPRAGRSRQRRWIPALIGIAVVIAVIVLVWRLFTGALFFYNADEAVAERAELGDDRFTLQGTPVGCTITSGNQGEDVVTAFTVAFDGVLVDVVHRGEPAELFEGGTPVVLDGSWVEGSPGVDGFAGLAADGWYYSSDRMRVKHDEDYINDEGYDERLEESNIQGEAAAEVCSV